MQSKIRKNMSSPLSRVSSLTRTKHDSEPWRLRWYIYPECLLNFSGLHVVSQKTELPTTPLWGSETPHKLKYQSSLILFCNVKHCREYEPKSTWICIASQAEITQNIISVSPSSLLLYFQQIPPWNFWKYTILYIFITDGLN